MSCEDNCEHTHLKARLVQNVPFVRYLVDESINLKILHVVCCNLSQTDVTKTVRPIYAVVIFLPIILNTDVHHVSVLLGVWSVS